MTTITLDIPDELAVRLGLLRERLPECSRVVTVQLPDLSDNGR
jgi:hypothetical protein